MGRIFDNGFAQLRLGDQLEDFFSTRKSKRSDHYSILWINKGMIDLSVDNLMLSLNENQMTFITPGKYVKILENHGETTVIQFNREFYCIRDNDREVSCEGLLYFGTSGVPLIHLGPKEVDSFNRLTGVLQEEFVIVDSIQEEMLRVILKKWLIKATRILKAQEQFVDQSEPRSELLRQFRILVEKNYTAHHKVSDYAKLLNKAPKTIANQFKLLGQESPSKIIQQRILAEAKRYLLFSPLSVKEIGFKLGFEDANSFSHFFKRITNIAPSEFRMSHQLL